MAEKFVKLHDQNNNDILPLTKVAAIIDGEDLVFYDDINNNITATSPWVAKNGSTMTGNLTAPKFIGDLQGNVTGNLNGAVTGTLNGYSATTDLMHSKYLNNYYGMATPTHSDTEWIRTTSQGIIPYQSGSATEGHQQLGTSTWYFADTWSTRSNSQWVHTNKGASGTDGGITLYNSNDNYSIFFRKTANQGTYGKVTGDWATYFLMSNTANRGWIFKRKDVGGVASISTDGNAVFKGNILATSTNSSWIDGLRYEHGGYNLTDATNTSSYWPWMRQTNTASAKWFSMGTLNNSLYFIGSNTSRTENGADYEFRMDFSNGYLYGNFSGNLSGTATNANQLGGIDATAYAKIQTGSYVGTNTYGSEANATFITCTFPIKVLIITQSFISSGTGYCENRIMQDCGLTTTMMKCKGPLGNGNATPSTVFGKKSDDGKTFTWYGTSAAYQANVLGRTYYWVAFG